MSNYNETSPHSGQNGSNQNHRKQWALARMWRKGTPCALLVGMQTGAATLEKSVQVPRKAKTSSTTGYLPKDDETTHPTRLPHPVFIAALFTMAKTQIQIDTCIHDGIQLSH